jgi:hypothetical protein
MLLTAVAAAAVLYGVYLILTFSANQGQWDDLYRHARAHGVPEYAIQEAIKFANTASRNRRQPHLAPVFAREWIDTFVETAVLPKGEQQCLQPHASPLPRKKWNK